MSDRVGAEGLASVVEVSSEAGPQAEKGGEGEDHGEHEDAGDDHGRRLCVSLEDVLDLGLGCVALGGGRECEGGRSVAGDLEVKDMLAERSGGAEGGEND